jgi:hypothetical protein
MGIEGSLAGKRVVISTDGGRLRVRKDKRGKKTKKGRSRYSTDWREPKLLVIYVVDEKGRIAQEFAPVIDGTLQGPDEVFRLLEFYLRELKVEEAKEVLFIADGAKWIWERVSVGDSGSDNLQGSDKRFRGVSNISSSFSELSWRKIFKA